MTSPATAQEGSVEKPRRNSFFWSRFFFLRILAIAFVGTFLSLGLQIHALIGPNGILPAKEFLQALARDQSILSCFLMAPSYLWVHAGELGLSALCWIGLGAAILLLFNVWPTMTLFTCWFSHLSFVTVAYIFSSFQSDSLLLEAAFLGLLIAPRGLLPGLGENNPPPRFGIWMLQWLLFRFAYGSGMAKLTHESGQWFDLNVMSHFYETIPFPSFLGFFAHHLPQLFHGAVALLILTAEIIAPFFLLFGQTSCMLGFFIWMFFQGWMLLTTNYFYLSLVAVGLGLFYLNDSLMNRLFRLDAPNVHLKLKRGFFEKLMRNGLLGFVFYLSFLSFLPTLKIPTEKIPSFLTVPAKSLQSFRLANRYRLFSQIPEIRKQMIFEGSGDDGKTWKEYVYAWSPQDLSRSLPWMGYHLPRLEWNLWFASQGSFQNHPFVFATAMKLLEGDEKTLGLFDGNPFSVAPPSRMRFPLYDYSFASWETWQEKGEWWQRKKSGDYAPALIRRGKDQYDLMLDQYQPTLDG